MSDDTEKAEELLAQSKTQKRHETNPAAIDESDNQGSLEEAVANAYARIESGELHQNLSVRDADLAALMTALEETGRLEEVGRRAAEQLGRDDEADTRASVGKLLLRLALNEIAAEEIEAAKAGKKQHLVSQADDF